MIKILTQSRELTEVEKYLMTISPAIEVLKNVPDGTKITVSATLEYVDIKENGDEAELLSILTPDNRVFSCQSATVKRSINDIKGIMGDKEFTVIKTSGKTKAGRDFINCELDVSAIK